MDILTLLYKLLIGPLELFFEVIFSSAYHFLGDTSLSIVVLSLAMNFLVLPLYRRADAMQEEERDRALRMKPWSDHIRKTFTGDERFMMLQTYNRQNGYKQTDVFKGSISLLLEIPFFIAAFHFLSNLDMLNGVPLGPIVDLGAPDALVQLGGLSINVLPILMTLINVISAAIYLKGFPRSSKIQTYGIAAIFLVLLYASPAGLVFYWTLNNLFSLIKNVFYKLENPKLVLSILAAITGLAVPAAVALGGIELSPLRIALIAAAFILLEAPAAGRLLRGRLPLPHLSVPEAAPTHSRRFFVACLFMSVLTGILIPTILINASPGEFVNIAAYRSPLWFVLESFMLALGTFCIWFGVFYWIATPKGKTIFSLVIYVLIGTAVVNYLFFANNYGNMSPQLNFTSMFEISAREKLVNLAVLTLVAIAIVALFRYKTKLLHIAALSLTLAVVAVSLVNAVGIQNAIAPTREAAMANQQEEPSIPLSTNGKNVVVIMLDRAVSQFVPYFMHERPDLAKSFAGFTHYANTVSYGIVTNIGSPALYGGADYRPAKMNERASLSLAEKHNEALKVMPTLFTEHGFSAALLDPPYAGYSIIPNLEVFDSLQNTHSYVTLNRSFMNLGTTEEEVRKKNSQQARNFFCYSIFKIAPLVLQPTLYREGSYNSTAPLIQVRKSYSEARGIDPWFLDSYNAIKNYPALTTLTNDSVGCFVMMSNNATHEATVLQEPEYTPSEFVNNAAYDTEHDLRSTADGTTLKLSQGTDAEASERITHYESNMAALLALGEWFNYLREQGVWDNTRIILVSDHSWKSMLDKSLEFTCPDAPEDPIQDVRAFTCMLMVKDFNAQEFTTDTGFMTNADVPSLAFEDIIENPKNPFTGNTIDNSYKQEGKQHLLFSYDYDIRKNNGNTFLPGYWYSVQGDTSQKENWEYLGNY